MDMILKNTFQSISPAYELIGDVTVGTATTQVDFTGLNIGKDDELLLVSDVTSGQSAYSEFYLFANNNTTLSNYYSQGLFTNNTSVSAERFNRPFTADVQSGARKFLAFIRIKLTNGGHTVCQSNESDLSGTNGNLIMVQNYCCTSTFTATSISQLTVKSAVANAIATGSRFQLYKLVAEKVADIIVPSNTTSVDITGLNIGKDGEYYLVSDYYNPAASGQWITFSVNDNTAITSYYEQQLYANGTSVTAVRGNDNAFNQASLTRRSLAMTPFKLTNSGVVTYQSNLCYNYTSPTTLGLVKNYGTSTFNVPAITKLTFTASATNAIGASSRFTLYKMK